MTSGPDFEDHPGQEGDGGKDQNPQPAGKETVVVEESAPGVMHDIAAEEKLEGNRESAPEPSDSERLSRGLERPFEAENPGVNGKD